MEQVKKADNHRAMLVEKILLQQVIHDRLRKGQGRRRPVHQPLHRAFADKNLTQVFCFCERGNDDLFLYALSLSPKNLAGGDSNLIR